MNATMKIGKDYIDFYNGNHTFYEMSLINVRPDNLDEWCNHMTQKNWFTQQMAVDFRKALVKWINFKNAKSNRN